MIYSCLLSEETENPACLLGDWRGGSGPTLQLGTGFCCGQAWLLPALGSVSPQWRRPRGPFLPSLLEEVDSDSVAIGARLTAASELILLPFITQALLAVCVEKQMFSPFRKSCETSHPGTAAQSQRLHACKVRPLEAHNGSKGCTGQAPGLPAQLASPPTPVPWASAQSLSSSLALEKTKCHLSGW